MSGLPGSIEKPPPPSATICGTRPSMPARVGAVCGSRWNFSGWSNRPVPAVDSRSEGRGLQAPGDDVGPVAGEPLAHGGRARLVVVGDAAGLDPPVVVQQRVGG